MFNVQALIQSPADNARLGATRGGAGSPACPGAGATPPRPGGPRAAAVGTLEGYYFQATETLLFATGPRKDFLSRLTTSGTDWDTYFLD